MTLNEQDAAPPSRWGKYKQPLQLILQTFSKISDQPEDFWTAAASYFERRDFAAGTTLYRVGETAKGFFLLEKGILKAIYDLPQGKYSELILAGTTCGELPFFSSTARTATTQADRDCITWVLTQEKWAQMQKEESFITQELLKISLKLTSERMDAVTKYVYQFPHTARAALTLSIGTCYSRAGNFGGELQAHRISRGCFLWILLDMIDVGYPRFIFNV